MSKPSVFLGRFELEDTADIAKEEYATFSELPLLLKKTSESSLEGISTRT